MIVRKFILRNSIGDYIDFLDNLDIFAISPEGLGVDFTNDLVDSGASFLIDKRGYEAAKVTFTVLLGAIDTEPYRAYERLVEVLSKPPYTLEYTTPVGTWERSCIPSAITKGEIGQLNILAEQFTVECLTPWYRWKEDRAKPPEDQKGDGKIYSKHTNWKYPDNAYTTPPLTYSEKDFWDYDASQPYPYKNELDKGNRIGKATIRPDLSSKRIITQVINKMVTPRGGYVMALDIDTTECKRSVKVYLNIERKGVVIRSALANSIVQPGVKSTYVKALIRGLANEQVGDEYVVRIVGDKAGSDYTDTVSFTKAHISQFGDPDSSYVTQDNYYSLTDLFNKNVFLNGRDSVFKQVSTSDGSDDAHKTYNIVPSIYPRIHDYIYEAKYVLDYTFKEWSIKYSSITSDEVGAITGMASLYGIYVDNSNSDANLIVKLVGVDSKGDIKVTYKSALIGNGVGGFYEFNNIKFENGIVKYDVYLEKGDTLSATKVNAIIGGEYWYNNYITKGRLVSNKGGTYIRSNEWSVATNMDKVADGIFYGYIYDYTYDAQEQSGNSFVIMNESQYMNDKVRSPLEVTIHGPAKKPRWEVIENGAIAQTDGFNLDVPDGYKLVVSSVPNEQRAVLVDPYGVESNVYQQQNLTMTNFVKLSSGTSILVFYGTENVTYRYREERVVV